MMKLLRYELRRLLLNKFFLGLAVVTGLYAWQVLSGDIIRGVAYTAPFSPWSFGAYLGKVQPLLLIGALFFVSFLYNAQARRIASVIQAAPIDPRALLMVRLSAMLVGCAVLCAEVLALGAVFYGRVFRYFDYGPLAVPAWMALVPPVLLALGAGLALGRVHVGLLYALMLALPALALVPLPDGLALGAGFFSNYPLTLAPGADGEVPFVVPAAVQIGCWAVTAAGALLASTQFATATSKVGASRIDL